MRLLPQVIPSSEQLVLLTDTKPGVLLIRGAAGSGKTTTALLRLEHLCRVGIIRRQRLEIPGPLRVLVLTFNKTLEGYIRELAKAQVEKSSQLHLQVSTFAKFAYDLAAGGIKFEPDKCEALLRGLCRRFGGSFDFIKDEVDYVLSRYEPANFNSYLRVRRDGRGSTPRMDLLSRQRLIDEILLPFSEQKSEFGWSDWNDLAIAASTSRGAPWDVVVVDEAQDFAAIEVRAIMSHVAEPHQVTFVMDSAQQIYPRNFTWREANASPGKTFRLTRNLRNTRQIAAFARPLIDGLDIGDDGTLPDMTAASRVGPMPRLLSGTYGKQLDWVITHVVKGAAAKGESVAFLKPRGGQWFQTLKTRLDGQNLAWVELTRQSAWPEGDEVIALSTLHSAKGLEFDHVIILGLNQQVTPHGAEEGDAQLDTLRRLVAMGVGRARESVTLGYKPGEASTLVSMLDPSTFVQEAL